MPAILRQTLNLFTSLKLTLFCLGLAMVLIFVGTIAQVKIGTFPAQKLYFESWLIYWTPKNSTLHIPVFPGGFFLGSVLLVNLIAAHVTRFKPTWKKSGIFLTHTGLILLLVEGLFTALWSREGLMTIDEGKSRNYSESFFNSELAVINTSNPDHDQVTSIPWKILSKQDTVSPAGLPFSVKVIERYRNADLHQINAGDDHDKPAAAQGVGARVVIHPMAETAKENERNFRALVVELPGAEGAEGTWLFSELLTRPQEVQAGGKTWKLELRRTRAYKPYSIELLDLTHEVYPGTDIPKNFASKVKLLDPKQGEEREALIYMNNPLRHGGETYYQFQVTNQDKTTVFQVVRNPSWRLPYIACALMTLGLIVQFGMHLTKFMNRRTA